MNLHAHFSSERPAPRRLQSDDSARTRGDSGYVIALTGVLIVPLLAFTAMAVDLGAWYAQAAREQRATDAASMAGVVYLPNLTNATNAAVNVMAANNFSAAKGDTITVTQVASNRLQVSVVKAGSRYFGKLFVNNVNISRTATAEFNKPIPMGSPSNIFGNDPSTCPQRQPDPSTCPGPMMWGAINGPFEGHSQGDPYATQCPPTGSCSGATTSSNPEYDSTGYEYALEVPAASAGSTITVQIYDAADAQRTVGNGGAGSDCNADSSPFNTGTYSSGGNFKPGFTFQNCQAGDSGDTGGSGSDNSQNFDVQVYANDGSDATVLYTSTQPSCHLQLLRTNWYGASHKNVWTTFCTISNAQQGIYPIRVKTSQISGISPDAGSNNNAYSIRATGAANLRVYPLDTMSIFTNAPGTNARFYLAEIPQIHAGKTLQIDLYDPGDGNSGDFYMQIKAPPGGTCTSTCPVTPGNDTQTVIPATNVVTSCKKSADTADRSSLDTAALANITNCRFQTRDSTLPSGSENIYNNRWLRVEIAISPNYTCSADCWWTVKYDFASGSGFPTDRTTWGIKVIGDPVHLVA